MFAQVDMRPGTLKQAKHSLSPHNSGPMQQKVVLPFLWLTQSVIHIIRDIYSFIYLYTRAKSLSHDSCRKSSFITSYK